RRLRRGEEVRRGAAGRVGARAPGGQGRGEARRGRSGRRRRGPGRSGRRGPGAGLGPSPPASGREGPFLPASTSTHVKGNREQLWRTSAPPTSRSCAT